MKHYYLLVTLYLAQVFLILSCVEENPNKEIVAEIKNKKTVTLDHNNYNINKEVYVPIYSDIYLKSKDYRTLLTATLSIRNTSSNDTLFVNNIDYHNTKGQLVNNYIENPIFLTPMETIEFVIDENDDTGGSGANFIIKWSSNKKISPLFQAVMIGSSGQHGFAFTTLGKEIIN